jgi:hypothetical protein
MTLSKLELPKLGGLLLAGAATAALAMAPMTAEAASGGSGQGKGAQAGQGGGHGGQGGAGKGGGRDLQSIFHDITGEDDGDESDAPDWAGEKGGKAGKGGGKPDMAGAKKGDLFGDLWVILRDDNGVPILTDEGWVQPIGPDGEPIELDEEGHPVDETLTQEVELGRLNVGRAPSSVLDRRAEEVIGLLNTATDVGTDPAGRLVLTVDGEEKTIDSPLENLAIYVALMTEGSIPGVDDMPGTAYDFMTDGKLTLEDMEAASSFLAAATDKTGVFSTDEIACINAFLGINTVKVGDVTYSDIDYEDLTYDRKADYDGVTAEVLVLQDDGSWKVETVNVYDAVFGGDNWTGTDGLDVFTQMADDSRAVINFVHEYEPPES